MRVTLVLTSAVAVVAVGIAGAGGAAKKNGRIVFAAGGIYRTDLVVLDGRSGRERTLKAAVGAEGPVPSPDGRYVAYVRQDPALSSFNAPIWIARLDGKSRRLVAHGQDQGWSPDSRHLVFTDCFGALESCQSRLLTVGRSGGGLRVVLTGAAEFPRWSPDGRWIAFTQANDPPRSQLCIVHPDGTGFRVVAADIADVYGYDWSPDSSRIVFTRNAPSGNGAELHVAYTDGQPEGQLTDDSTMKYQPRWSPDGTSIAYGASDGTSSTVMVVRAGGGVPHVVDEGSRPVWSRDGRLAFWTSDSGIGIARPDGYTRRLRLGIGAVRWNLDWIPHRDALLLTRQTYDNESHLMSVLPTGAAARPIGSKSLVAVDPAWSPDGRRLALAIVHPGGSRDLAIIGANGRLRRLTTNRFGWDSQPTWSPDGRRIAFIRARSFQDAMLDLIRLRDRRVRPLGVKTRWWAHPAWSPDGRTIALDGLRRTPHEGLRVLDLATGELSDLTAGQGGWDTRAAWSPDGMHVAFSRTYFGGSAVPTVAMVQAVGGGEPTVVARGDPWLGVPPVVAWSPDGRRLVIAGVPSGGPSYGWEVELTDLDGSLRALPWTGDLLPTGVSWQPR